MMKRNTMLAIALAVATLAGSSHTLLSAEQADQALLKAIGGAKISLLQGIAQVAKTEVPTEAKYEMEDGKLMLSVYTSAKGLDTAAEDNSFNEYGGDATAATSLFGAQVAAVASPPYSLKELSHRPVGAVPHAAVDDQDDAPGDHPKSISARHGLFRQGKNPQRQTRLRGDDGARRYGQDDVL